MDGGGYGEWRGGRRRKCDLFFFLWGDSQDTVGRIFSFGSAHKRASVFSVTGQSLNFYCDYPEGTELNSEQDRKLSKCYKHTSSCSCIFVNHDMPQCCVLFPLSSCIALKSISSAHKPLQ